MSSLTICNAQKLLPLTGSLEPTGAIDINFNKGREKCLLSHIISWNEGDSYTVYFREPVPTSDIRICNEKVSKGAKSFHGSTPISQKNIQWEASNGQEFSCHFVTIDITSDTPVKLQISEVIINRKNGEIIRCTYPEYRSIDKDNITTFYDSNYVYWEADNGEEFGQYVVLSDSTSLTVDYYSGFVTISTNHKRNNNGNWEIVEHYIGGTEWVSNSASRTQYRLKLYSPTNTDNIAWKYVTKAGDTHYQKIEKNTTLSILNIDEEITECCIAPINYGEDYPDIKLEIQEVSLIDGSQPKFETLVLWHANGKTTEISLSKKPRVTFSEDKVLVKGSGITFEYSANDILKFTYKKEDVVNDIDTPNNVVNFFRDEEHIVFNGIKSTDEVALYKLNGSRIPVQLTHSDDNKVTLSLSGIPSGIYILKVNGKTTKITKQ